MLIYFHNLLHNKYNKLPRFHLDKGPIYPRKGHGKMKMLSIFPPLYLRPIDRRKQQRNIGGLAWNGVGIRDRRDINTLLFFPMIHWRTITKI